MIEIEKVDRTGYKLVESTYTGISSCERCALIRKCDNIAMYLSIPDYMLCAEEEEFEFFENPIYVKDGSKTKQHEEKINEGREEA